jgi:hypothetical protein
MTVELGVLRKGSWSTIWPAFVGGLCGPLLGRVMARWFAFHLAVGFAVFVTWFFVGLIFARRSPPKWDIPAWLAALMIGAVTGLTAGVLTYYFPWN